MTIFFSVLKEIIKSKLSELETQLAQQPKGTFGWFYNKDLSKEQSKLISTLRDAITMHPPANNNNDAANALNLTKLINDTISGIEKAREKHGKSDDGKTATDLGKIVTRIAGFLKKMGEFKFKLLDKPSTITPESKVYYYSTYYLGQNIFSPHKHDDPKIRAQKEDALAKRLLQLSQLIKATDIFETQKKWSLQALADIDTDNAGVVNQQKSAIEVPLSYVTMMGMGLKAPLAAKEGRLADATKLARDTINAMTAETSACPRAPASAAAPAKPGAAKAAADAAAAEIAAKAAAEAEAAAAEAAAAEAAAADAAAAEIAAKAAAEAEAAAEVAAAEAAKVEAAKITKAKAVAAATAKSAKAKAAAAHADDAEPDAEDDDADADAEESRSSLSMSS